MKKEYILQEIKRTAAANASVPLGSRKFESETGIKYHDWFGIHWARWNDAVREAGFAPNQLRVGYQETELLEKYATLARELGRLPAKGDLRLKSSNDSEWCCQAICVNGFSFLPSQFEFRRLRRIAGPLIYQTPTS
jgi:hypothetical protein